MDPHELSIKVALWYILGIMAAALIFRIIRSWRRRRVKKQQPLL